MKQLVFLVLVCSLAGCGGYHKAKRSADVSRSISAPAPAPDPVSPRVQPAAVRSAPVPTISRPPSARGPIQKACMASDRKARSARLCGCIQAVADQTLSSADQRRAAGFYRDPHSAQEVRQSDRPNDETFWKTYRAYGAAASRTCG